MSNPTEPPITEDASQSPAAGETIGTPTLEPTAKVEAGAAANPTAENTPAEKGAADQKAADAGSPSKGRLRRLRANRPPRQPGEGQGCIFQVALVTAVALILATLFTAWTPGRPNPSLRSLFFSAGSPGVTEAARATLLPSPTFPPGAPTPTPRNPRLVGIVAGHWKNDSGAVCSDGLTEASINLEIATRVQKLLTEAGYEAELLAEFDPRLRDYQAAALISIHNDSCEFINADASGYKVASALATRDPNQAARLAACLRSRYGAATQLPLHSASLTRDMTSYHSFDEISGTTPAAIIETGFLNADRQVLTERPDVVAYGVAAGILCYLRNETIATPTAGGAPTAGETAAAPTTAPTTEAAPAAATTAP